MDGSRIQTGAKEPIEALILDFVGSPLTGSTTIKVKIRRQSDGMFFDWSDNRFKVSPVALLQVMEEVNAAKCPGEYKLNTVDHVNGFDTSKILNPNVGDIYEVTVIQDPVSTAANVPQIGEIKVGQFVDYIPEFSDNERTEIKTVLGVTGTGIPTDTPSEGVMRLILGLVQHNFFLDNAIYNASALLTSARIRIFPTKALTDAATDGGIGEGEIASFRVTATPDIAPLEMVPKTYKMTRES